MNKSFLSSFSLVIFISLFSSFTLAQDDGFKNPTIPEFYKSKIRVAASNQARKWMDELNRIAERREMPLSGEAKVTAFDILFKRAQHLLALGLLDQEEVSPQILWVKSDKGTSTSEALASITHVPGVLALYIKETKLDGENAMEVFITRMANLLANSENKNVLVFDQLQGTPEMTEELVRFLKDVTRGAVTSIIVDQNNQLEELNPLIQNMVEVMDLRKSVCDQLLRPVTN